MEKFHATITDAGRAGGAFVPVPPAVVEALGGKGRIPVRATFDGIAYTGSVVTMGGQKVIGILKGIQAQLGKSAGDPLTVTLERDDTARKVTPPDDLARAL